MDFFHVLGPVTDISIQLQEYLEPNVKAQSEPPFSVTAQKGPKIVGPFDLAVGFSATKALKAVSRKPSYTLPI